MDPLNLHVGGRYITRARNGSVATILAHDPLSNWRWVGTITYKSGFVREFKWLADGRLYLDSPSYGDLVEEIQ
jgi:hypothetical protein